MPPSSPRMVQILHDGHPLTSGQGSELLRTGVAPAAGMDEDLNCLGEGVAPGAETVKDLNCLGEGVAPAATVKDLNCLARGLERALPPGGSLTPAR